MSPSDTSTQFLNISSNGDFITAVSSLFQCLKTLLVKFFIVPKQFPLVQSLVNWGGWPPPDYNLLSGGYREQEGPPWASLSPGWSTPAPSATPHRFVFQTIHQLPRFYLDLLKPLSVFLVVNGPKVNMAFEVQVHQCQYKEMSTALVLLATQFLIHNSFWEGPTCGYWNRLLFQWNSVTPSHISQLLTCKTQKCLKESHPFLVLVAESEVKTTKLIQLQRKYISLSPGLLIRDMLQAHSNSDTLHSETY